jgi:hypothetical protein
MLVTGLGFSGRAGAVAKITDDVEERLAFHNSPAQQWIHLRTNPIESTFASVRHRTKATLWAGLACGRAGDGRATSESQHGTVGVR